MASSQKLHAGELHRLNGKFPETACRGAAWLEWQVPRIQDAASEADVRAEHLVGFIIGERRVRGIYFCGPIGQSPRTPFLSQLHAATALQP